MKPTLSGLVFTLLLVIGLFTGMYLWLTSNANSGGIVIPNNYSNVYSNLSSESSSIKNTINEIESDIRNLSEAKDFVQVAINGFKGIGDLLKLPISFVSDATSIYRALLTFLPVPDWVKDLIGIAIIASIIFLVYALVKGESDRV